MKLTLEQIRQRTHPKIVEGADMITALIEQGMDPVSAALAASALQKESEKI